MRIEAKAANGNEECLRSGCTHKHNLPDDPLEIARQCSFGQDQLTKANDLVLEDYNKADLKTGRPAFYDNAIPTEYNHSIGTRKGPMK